MRAAARVAARDAPAGPPPDDLEPLKRFCNACCACGDVLTLRVHISVFHANLRFGGGQGFGHAVSLNEIHISLIPKKFVPLSPEWPALIIVPWLKFSLTLVEYTVPYCM